MYEKKLWQKISGSITFYLKDYDIEKSNEELLKDYLDYVLPDDLEEKAIGAFVERLNRRRLKEEPIEKVEKKEYKNNVFSFDSYKNDGQIRRK